MLIARVERAGAERLVAIQMKNNLLIYIAKISDRSQKYNKC
jgi:hypothetical protein